MVILRRSIEKFQAWFDDAAKNVVNKGDFGGALRGRSNACATSCARREAARTDAVTVTAGP